MAVNYYYIDVSAAVRQRKFEMISNVQNFSVVDLTTDDVLFTKGELGFIISEIAN